VTAPRVRLGMVHGRFQPFHNGHLAYLLGAAAASDEVYVGITNPDPARVLPDPLDLLRHLPESNPFTYAERQLMVKAAAQDAGLDLARVHVIPFPVNEPELWPAYVPAGVTHFIRLFSDWGRGKRDRLEAAGYPVVVLDEGDAKEVSGADVRAALRAGDPAWRALVPAGVARVLDGLGSAALR
jgi:nicotinamide-nucleotide adenylyltransferase